ncbi:methyltransferase domain-containing protein [Candidatus Uhrbacteria bacterium]|nr:methyltransferase domain-containing protein [Candidatus Uhrbacteria bacterium]
MSPRRILEIGPGPNPLHYRGEEKRLQLEEGEEYHGVDQSKRIFESEVWERAKTEYGDRVFLYEGDRADLKDIEDASMDEVIALGTHGQDGRIVAEFNRVLRPGGKILLGVPLPSQERLLSSWGVRLNRAGYTSLPSETKNYNYRGNMKESRPYIVLVWQKGNPSR